MATTTLIIDLRYRIFAFILCASIVIIYLLVYDVDYLPIEFQTVDYQSQLQIVSFQLSIDNNLTITNNSTTLQPKLILTWTPFFGSNLSATITAWLVKHPCVYQCEYTNDRTRVSDANALIFHPRDDVKQLPTIRHSHQYYIFYLQESPFHTGDLNRMPIFNLTMTYRYDSDIVMYYDALFPIKSNDSNLDHHIIYSWKQVTDAVAIKTKMALQFVSNCGTNSRRELYVKKLIATGLEVDRFGACGGGQRIKCAYGTECEDELVAKYRFYLAFENSVCRDYVTEKFWRMKKLIVPLVLRAKDYEHIAPIGSYIAVDQFQSITQLVTYLKMLSTNTTEYLKYFEWTRTYRGPDRSRPFGFSIWNGYCELCQLLHNRSTPQKPIRICKNGGSMKQIVKVDLRENWQHGLDKVFRRRHMVK